MRRILVTGMSGTGKSTVLAELSRKGHRVVDTDLGEWVGKISKPTVVFPIPSGPFSQSSGVC